MKFRNVPLFASSQTMKLECERKKFDRSGPGGFAKIVDLILYIMVTKYFVQAVVLKTQKIKLEMKH